ncbi:MAG: DNA polymerase III subunit beta [Tissierellia bacterium]|nr:DNA polymerase III subunit beta [Tissierellia bacterium]
MKIIIPQRVLNDGINVVQRSISTRSQLPILDGILIRAMKDGLKLTGTNLDMSIELLLPAMVQEEGLIVVNSRLFSEIVKRLPDQPITINCNEQNMSIKCGNSSFQLIGFSGDEYPSLPLVEEEKTFTVPSHILRKSIRQTVFAVAQDNFRPIFTGVLFQVKDNAIEVVALDGYRLAKREIGISGQGEMSIVVPGKNLIELSRILDSIEEDVTIKVSGSHLKITMNHMEFYSILLEGDFFRYEEILRTVHPITAIADRQQLLESVERAALLAREDKANLLKLTLSENTLTIQSQTEMGSVEEIVDVDYMGESLKIAFSSRYLLDGIKNMESDKLKLYFSDSVNPLIIQGEDEEQYLYLVLPVRLAKED